VEVAVWEPRHFLSSAGSIGDIAYLHQYSLLFIYMLHLFVVFLQMKSNRLFKGFPFR